MVHLCKAIAGKRNLRDAQKKGSKRKMRERERERFLKFEKETEKK